MSSESFENRWPLISAKLAADICYEHGQTLTGFTAAHRAGWKGDLVRTNHLMAWLGY